MSDAPHSVAKLGVQVTAVADEDVRWRLLLGFLDAYQQADREGRPAMLSDEPRSTGSRRWDVMLAAVAEHLAYQADVAAPSWVRADGREWLGRIWWVVPLPSARPWALAHSPASFRRRGIFLHPDDLAVA